MGFEKWFFRNSPGSPGHTARTIVKLYQNYKLNNFNEESDQEIYSEIYFFRLELQEKLKNKGSLLGSFIDRVNNNIIIELDMPLFVFAFECLETNQFRFGITNNNIDSALEVIREEVEKIDENLIALEFNDYRNKAINFLNLVLDYTN
jgi:hypothetical protein